MNTKTGPTDTDNAAITGVQAMRGEGVQVAKGFWAEAWQQVLTRPTAILGLVWLSVVSFFAVFSPVLANGHPWKMTVIKADPDTLALREVGAVSYPLIENLSAADWTILAFTILGGLFIVLPIAKLSRGRRLGIMILLGVQAAAIVSLTAVLKSDFGEGKLFGILDWIRSFATTTDANGVLQQSTTFPYFLTLIVTLVTIAALSWIPTFENLAARFTPLILGGALCAVTVIATWTPPLSTFGYGTWERQGYITATYTLIPWSPNQRPDDRNTSNLEPGTTYGQALTRNFENKVVNYFDGANFNNTNPNRIKQSRVQPDGSETPIGDVGFQLLRITAKDQPVTDEVRQRLLDLIDRTQAQNPDIGINAVTDLIFQELSDVERTYFAGTDNQNQDVLSQMLHACRLSISIGLVSTGISVLIGVTFGSLMGYFGGWVDLLLYRIVEIFMAIPVLFLLIVAAGVLPKNIYVMMIIIGCFSWTGSARFIRAEFLKLRNQDFVQSARATGLPLRSILFKHMLPNGVTPVLVESSFAIAAAILAEATLSFLGLGPDDQPSWGKLLASANSEVGEFYWWVAIIPGLAIFLTVLSYNLIGEALRDAIDPKLKKARV